MAASVGKRYVAPSGAEIIVTNLVNALTIPLQAVTTVKGKQVCYVQNGAGLVPVPVTVGNFNDQFIEIRTGLNEGDHVALTPPAPANDDIEASGSVLSGNNAPNNAPNDTPNAAANVTAKKSATGPSRL